MKTEGWVSKVCSGEREREKAAGEDEAMAGFGRGEKKRNQAVTQHSEILSAPVTEGSVEVEGWEGGRGDYCCSRTRIYRHTVVQVKNNNVGNHKI